MESISIDDGTTRLAVNDDPNRVFSFNPLDTNFTDKFYAAAGELQVKLSEYTKRGRELGITSTDPDEAKLPEQSALIHELCTYMRSQIDQIFGPGTSQVVFEDTNNPLMFVQFFNQVTEKLSKVRGPLVDRFMPPVNALKQVQGKARGKRRK